MKRKGHAARSLVLTIAVGLAGLAAPALAQQAAQEPIYGSQLMTPQERSEYRERMRSAQTAEEREKLRLEHHQQMQARAKERGITLPESPPAKPRAGAGMGMGGGMGPGSGMGPGRGMGGGGGPRR